MATDPATGGFYYMTPGGMKPGVGIPGLKGESGDPGEQGPSGRDGSDRFLVEVDGAYPPRPDDKPVVFVGSTKPVSLALPGDTWIAIDSLAADVNIVTSVNGMTGDVVLEAGGGWARQTTVHTTTPLVAGAHRTGTLDLAPSYRLLRVATDKPARIRLYTTPSKRDADLERAPGVKPTGDHGRLAEFITTTEVPAVDCSPLVDGQVADATSMAPFSIVNTGSAGTITLTLTWIRTE